MKELIEKMHVKYSIKEKDLKEKADNAVEAWMEVYNDVLCLERVLHLLEEEERKPKKFWKVTTPTKNKGEIADMAGSLKTYFKKTFDNTDIDSLANSIRNTGTILATDDYEAAQAIFVCLLDKNFKVAVEEYKDENEK